MVDGDVAFSEHCQADGCPNNVLGISKSEMKELKDIDPVGPSVLVVSLRVEYCRDQAFRLWVGQRGLDQVDPFMLGESGQDM